MDDVQIIAGPGISGVSLDISETMSIPTKVRAGDVRDPQSRKSARTQGVTFPATTKNDQFFGGIFDVNTDYSLFNPNVKTDVKLSLNGNVIIDGYLQLKRIITDDKGDRGYECILYDKAVDFYRKVEKKKVIDLLNITDLNHTLDRDTLKNSWLYEWDLDHLAAPGGGFFYPYLNGPTSKRKVADFQPAIFEKRILDMIVDDAGLTWSGSLKDDLRFERDVLTYIGDTPQVSEAVAALKAMWIGRSSDITLLTNTDPLGFQPYINVQIPLNDESTAPFDDSNNLWSVDTMTAASSGLYKFEVDMVAQITTQYDILTAGASEELAHSIYAELQIKNTLGQIINPTFAGVGYRVEFDNKNNNLAQSIGSSGQITVGTKFDGTAVATNLISTLSAPLPELKTQFTGAEVDGAIFMGAGWTAELFLRLQSVHRFVGNYTLPIVYDVNVDSVDYEILSGGSLRSLQIQRSYTDGDSIDIRDFIDPELEQIDILRDIAARYNCWIVPDPVNARNLKFEIRDEYLKTGPVYDWTDKQQHDARMTLKPIGEELTNEIVLSYMAANDEVNEQYSNIASGDIYGQLTRIIGNEFVKGTKRIETPFEPTPFVRLVDTVANQELIVSAIDINAPKSGQRVLHAKLGKFTGDVSAQQDGSQIAGFELVYRDSNGFDQIEVIVGYPWAGHYDDPINPTFDINFGTTPVVMALMHDTFIPPADNLYSSKWENTIDQLENGNIMKDLFNLTAEDVFNIRQNPNARIFIENAYWYVNSIVAEANLKLKKLAIVELVTVEDFIPVPTGPTEERFLGSSGDGGGKTVEPSQKSAPLTGNIIGKNVKNYSIEGTNNIIKSDSKNICIKGDDNIVGSNLKNVQILGDNIKVYGSNVSVKNTEGITVTGSDISINGNTMTVGTESFLLFNKIEGAKDALRTPNTISHINLIDGGKDELRTLFPTSTINKIDTINGKNDLIE